MFRKGYSLALFLVTVLFVSGCCATNRKASTNDASSYDANAARVASLQSQNAQKDAEIQRLQEQANQEAAARAAAEAEKQALAQRLEQSVSDLENSKASYVKKTEASDLK